MDYFDWYAVYLHRTCPVADGHRDLVTEVYRRRQGGETGVLNRLYKKEFQKSGVNLIFASLFLGADELEDCKENDVFPGGAVLKKSMEMLAAFYADLEETKGRVQLVIDKESLLKITAKRNLTRQHRVGVLLYLEGLDMLEGEPELLRCFYAMGVRGAALTWNVRCGLPNPFAEGCGKNSAIACDERKDDDISGARISAPNHPAITDKGVQALFLMEQLGIFVDSSHLSREAAWLLPSFTKKPYAATHSNAEALLAHERNLTDEEIKAITGRGGVIGVNAYREFNDCGTGGEREEERTVCDTGGERQEKRNVRSADSPEKRGISALCDQIVYLTEAAGEDHVGLGLDLGEGNLLADYNELPALTAELLRRGTSVETVKRILGGNWIRYLMEIF